MSGTVIENQTGLQTSPASATGSLIQAAETPLEVRTADELDERVNEHLIDLRQIYPDPGDGVATAMRVLAESIDACQQAIEAKRQGQELRADSSMLTTQSLLPDLIAVQRIGEGFGIVVSSLVFSFANQAGLPFSLEQMNMLLRAYKAVWQAPFMSLDRAVALTDELENVGLKVDPAPLTNLYVWAEEEGFVDAE